jgi:predicted enzyme related to lactoylglutathione lyase
MTLQLHAVCFDAHDPEGLARFWAGVLNFEPEPDAVTLRPTDDTGFLLRFNQSDEPKTVQNQMHFDLTSTSLEDQQATVARALDLGGRHIDVGQLPEERHVVLADPEGNEFCVLEPGNNFLAGCPFLGAIASDGTQAVGYFWSKALNWPLVWDQDEETAIQSPHGGPKITWGGPPVAPKPKKNRLHFDLTADDQQAEVARLTTLGATPLDLGQGNVPWTVMADPDGNEFCVLNP